MVKKIVFSVWCVLFALLALPAGWAQAYNINTANLPTNAAFRRHVEEFKPLMRYVSAWSPEWTAKIPKAKVQSTIENLLQETKSFVAKDKGGNADLLLLQALLKSCLYNMNLPAYHEEVVAELTALKKQFPADYRAYWMLANHYASTDDPFSTLKEYEHIVFVMFKDKSEPAVLDDYIKACFFTMLYSRAKALIEDIAAQNKIADPGKISGGYPLFLKLLKEPPRNHTFPNSEIFIPQRREYEVGFLNRVLGIWIPVKDGWGTSAFELKSDGFSLFTVNMPMQNAGGKTLPGTINLTIQGFPQQPFQLYIETALAALEKKREYKEWKNPWAATIYEYWDTKSLPEEGGEHGMIVFIQRSQPAVKGLAIEAPAKYPGSSEGDKVDTVIVGEGYTRFDGDIYYTIMLNSPESVFEAAKAEFFEFLNRVLLD